MKEIGAKLRSLLGAEAVKPQEPLSRHTTFRIGGPAEWFAAPADEATFCQAVRLCRQEGIPWYVIGNGSNLLADDAGFGGVVLSTEGLCGCRIEGTEAAAGAGILLSRLARQAAERSLTGLEFAAGIPGTLGGAVVMNAGAYGSEMKDVLTWARVLAPDGAVYRLEAPDLELGYRTSCISGKGYVVLEAGLRLQAGDRDAIQERMADLAARRSSRQPLEYPSAGSTFKRPPGHFAGQLIEEAGLRGFAVGQAQVSEKHCGFVINRGGASSAEVLALCREVQRRVRERFGVELELEVRQLNDSEARR